MTYNCVIWSYDDLSHGRFTDLVTAHDREFALTGDNQHWSGATDGFVQCVCGLLFCFFLHHHKSTGLYLRGRGLDSPTMRL